jgi:hypothetical protein
MDGDGTASLSAIEQNETNAGNSLIAKAAHKTSIISALLLASFVPSRARAIRSLIQEAQYDFIPHSPPKRITI